MSKKAIIGWTGTFFIILAYTLNSLGYLKAQGLIYPILNFFGAIFLGLRVYWDRNWSNLFLEIFWGLVAIYSLYQYFN